MRTRPVIKTIREATVRFCKGINRNKIVEANGTRLSSEASNVNPKLSGERMGPQGRCRGLSAA